MSIVATELYFFLSIIPTLIYLVNCGKCPLDGVKNLVDYDACRSYKSNDGLQNSLTGSFSLDHALGQQKRVSAAPSVDVCGSCELFYFSSMLYGFNSQAQCSRTGFLDVNRSGLGASLPELFDKQHADTSWSSDCHAFHLPDEGTVTCSLNYRELDLGISPASVNKVDDVVLSSCGGYLSLLSKNVDIEKFQSKSSAATSPHVNISPQKLDWGQNYIYHPSVAILKLQNACNESDLEVYEPFSTNTQFYPFNFSDVVLGPGEATALSFVFSPKWLGLSSAELILQTSFGGFLIEAQGFGVESPHRLQPLKALEVSSSGWLSRKLPLLNPYNDSVHLEKVTAWVGVYGSSASLLAEAICSKRGAQDTNSRRKPLSSVRNGKANSVVMEIRPISNWMVNPYNTESVLEMAFAPGVEGEVLGTICMELVRPLNGEKDILIVPVEAELNRSVILRNTDTLLSVSVEAVGCYEVSETVISISVQNNGVNLVKIIRINEVSDRKNLQQIKYLDGLLLLPGTATHVALVTYESANINDDSFIEMDDINMSCMLEILTNDTISPVIEVSCREIISVCSKMRQEMYSHLPGINGFSRTGYLTSSGKLPFPIQALRDAEVDEYVLQNWMGLRTLSGLYVLDDQELVFPTVPIGKYFAKSITVKNPSEQHVIVQLILNTGVIMDNCKTHYGHLQQPSSASFIHENSSQPIRYGFSLINNAVTEAYLLPYGSAKLGPILFHPSSRCEWKSSALIRNNLSGVEWLSLRGIGGSLSLALLEGSELVEGLDFNFKLLFPHSMFPLDITSNIKDANSGCRRPLSKKLLVVNAGDFPVKVLRIHVSGTECGLDGFIVHNCKAFAVEPGESVELGISYMSDFSTSMVLRDLELILAAGKIIIPMNASLPHSILNFCRKSIFWLWFKKCCLAVVLATIFLSILFWFLMPQMILSAPLDYLIKGDKNCSCVGRPRGKQSSLNCSKGNGKSIASAKKGCSRSVQRDSTAALESVLMDSNRQRLDLKQGIITELRNLPRESETENGPSPVAPMSKKISSPSLLLKSIPAESPGKYNVGESVSLTVRTGKDKRRRHRKRKGVTSGLTALADVSSSQSGNSTPSSPLSPFTNMPPEETYYPSLGKTHLHDSSGPFGVTGHSCDMESEAESGPKINSFGSERVVYARDSGNRGDPQVLTQQQLLGPKKAGTKPLLSPSATFPGTVYRSCAPPSRLAIAPHARAPGPKLSSSVEEGKQASSDDSLIYDIWGNHFSGLHLITRPNNPSTRTSEVVASNSESFFVKGPQQALLINYRPSSVSSSYEQG